MDTSTQVIVARPRLWRQGDILIEELTNLPAKLRSVRGKVIARGEATGHSHKLSGKGKFRLYSPVAWRGVPLDTMLYLTVFMDGCDLVHPEHGPIHLKAGNYKLWRQQEFDPLRRAVRIAAD